MVQGDEAHRGEAWHAGATHRLGLKRALPCPVVSSFMLGGRCGYCAGKNRSNTNSPPSYGVSSGPAAAHQAAADD